jgi:hypothetical protein
MHIKDKDGYPCVLEEALLFSCPRLYTGLIGDRSYYNTYPGPPEQVGALDI